MQEIFALEGCQMNYIKYLELITYGKQAAVFTETETGKLFFQKWTILPA